MLVAVKVVIHSCIMPLVSITLPPSTVVEIGFDPTSYTMNEDSGTVILRVRKTGTNEIPVTVDISTSGDTAGGMYTLYVLEFLHPHI